MQEWAKHKHKQQLHAVVIKVFYPRPRLISDKSSQSYEDSAVQRKERCDCGGVGASSGGSNDEYSIFVYTIANWNVKSQYNTQWCMPL